jgi:hypothetical protein
MIRGALASSRALSEVEIIQKSGKAMRMLAAVRRTYNAPRPRSRRRVLVTRRP